MFKFDNYPTIKEFHIKFRKKDYSSTKKLIRAVNTNRKGSEKSFDISMKKEDRFNYIYGKVIFDALINEKPNILDLTTGEYESWDTLVGVDYEKIPNNEKILLVLLVEENGGIYRLPPEYYEV